MEFLGQSRHIIGFEDVFKKIKVQTPYGDDKKRDMSAYCVADYDKLIADYDILDLFVRPLKRDKHYFRLLRSTLVDMLDLRGTLGNIAESIVLSQVEFYELKHLLLQLKTIIEKYGKFLKTLPKYLHLTFPEQAYAVLDPQLLYADSFYIGDDFSDALSAIREQLKDLDEMVKRQKIKLVKSIVADYPNLRFRPNGTVVVSQKDVLLFKRISSDRRLYLSGEHYDYATFSIVLNDEIKNQLKMRESLVIKEEEALFVVRKRMTKELKPFVETIVIAVSTVGWIDLYLAKAYLAIGVNGVRPDMVQSGKELYIEDGRHIAVEAKLTRERLVYTPVSVRFNKNTTLITGANMGGKTITLKMIGLIVAMAHYGLYVPASAATIPHYHYIRAIIGDEQSVDKGLSTFGAEMVQIKQALDIAEQGGLILIDELARGTNPKEGWALSDSIVEALAKKQATSVITTHFDGLGKEADVLYLQVVGLAHYDWADGDLATPQRLVDYMDYRLQEVSGKEDIPKDALNIANLLGIDKKILERAKRKLDKRHS